MNLPKYQIGDRVRGQQYLVTDMQFQIASYDSLEELMMGMGLRQTDVTWI
jgi:hypothetical protein